MNLGRAACNRCVIAFLLSITGALCVPTAVSSSGTATPGAGRVVELRIVARKPEGGARTVRATRGERIVLAVRTDEAMTLHVHGYEVRARVTPGHVARIAVLASAVGRFPVTAHLDEPGQAHRREPTLLYLEVHPE
jgi:hypothetical protein